MNKYLVFLKNPKIWFGIILFIGIIVSIILIIKALKPTHLPETKLCGMNETKITCSDGSIKCAPICLFSGMTWDCVSGKCECTDKQAQVCGNECCTSCNSELNACCPDDQVYKDGDVTKCCQAGTKPNKDRNGCVPVCGILTCNTDEECINIEGLKGQHRQATIDSLNKEGIDVDSQSSPDIIYCAKRASCGWSDETAEPSSILNNYFFHNFSKNSLDGQGNNGIYGCFPDDSSNEDCYRQTNEQGCNGTTGCTWKNLLDELNNDTTNNLGNFRDQMGKRNKAHNRSNNGDYCQTSDVYGRYIRYTSKSPTCTVADCIRQVSNNNTVQVAYKEMEDGTKYCGALRVPQDNGIRVTCNGVTDNGGCDIIKDATTDPTEFGWVFKQCDDESTRISSSNCPIINGSTNKCNTQEDNEQHLNDERRCNISGNYACADDAQFIDYKAPTPTWTVIDAPSGKEVGKKTGRIAKKCDGTQPSGSFCYEQVPSEINTFTGNMDTPPYCDTKSGYVLNNHNTEHPNSDCIYICQAKDHIALDPTVQENNDNTQKKYYGPLHIGKYYGYPPLSNKYFCYRRPIDYNIPTDDPNHGNMCTGHGWDQRTPEFVNNLTYQGYSCTEDCEYHNGLYQKMMTDTTPNIKKIDQNNDNIPEFLYMQRTMQEDTQLNPSQRWCNVQGPFLLANMSDSGLYVPDIGAVYASGTDTNGYSSAKIPVLCPDIANQLPNV